MVPVIRYVAAVGTKDIPREYFDFLVGINAVVFGGGAHEIGIGSYVVGREVAAAMEAGEDAESVEKFEEVDAWLLRCGAKEGQRVMIFHGGVRG